MPISRRDINPGDYVLYRHQNSGKILVTRMEGGRAEREVGEYLGYRSMEDAAAAARADARRRHAQRYQIYFENIGGLHVFTRNARQMDDERGYPMDLHGHVTGDTDAMAAQKYHNFLMKHYGVDSRTASKLTPAVLAKVDAWRERNGLPSPSSPLVRGYINDLVGSRPRGPMRNPPSAPRPPRPGRRVARKRGAQPAAVLPRLRRMIDDSERGDFDPERRYPREVKPHHFAVNSDADPVREFVVEGAANAFFVSAWADGAEEAGHRFPGGTKLDEVAPEVPEELVSGAERFVDSLEKLNRMSIDEMYQEAAEAPGRHDRDPDPEDFGWSIAMQAIGSGAGWEDDHPTPPGGMYSYPSVEVHVGVSEDDIDDVSVEWFEISERLSTPRGG